MERLPLIAILAGICLGASAGAVDSNPTPQPKPSGDPLISRAERSASAWLDQYRWRREVLDRAYELRPARRDWPARYENITDEEVREVQAASREYVPRALVNIGTVTMGCPCEDGAACTEQVWVIATRREKSYGLQLSKIDKRWTVGPVQRWWHRKDTLRPESFPTYAAFERAEEALIGEFPVCVKAGALKRATTPS